MVQTCGDSCQHAEATEKLVQYLDRYVHIRQAPVVPVKVGTKKDHQTFAYLGYDVERAADETRKATEPVRKHK